MVVPGRTQTVAPLSSLALLIAELLRHHEALAVVVVDGHEVQAELGLTGQGAGRVAGQHVDLARLQGGETLLCGQGDILDLTGIAENGSGHGAGGIDIEAFPDPFLIGHAEAEHAAVDTGHDDAFFDDSIKILAGKGSTCCEE